MTKFFRHIIPVLLVLMVGTVMQSQNALGQCRNLSISSAVVDDIQLPEAIDALFFLDGKLHVSSDGMLFAVSVKKGVLGIAEFDTALMQVDHELSYAVRHPVTGSLFFTKKDENGDEFLYEYFEKKPGKYEVRRIKPARFSFTIERPVFTADGKTMIFASNCPLGFGGKDLWYSQWREDKWQYPQNIGHRINTVGDDFSPVLYGDFLLYSSNGRESGCGGYDIYSARLVAQEQTGDTVAMFPIGRCPAFSMEYPLCSAYDDHSLALNDNGSGGWWLTRRFVLNDSSLRRYDKLHSFTGALDCVRLSGMVNDVNGNPVPSAKVTVRRGNRDDYSAEVAPDGNYCLFLQPDEDYELVFAAPEFFSTRQNVSAKRVGEESLYALSTLNIMLQSFNIGSPYSFGDLFSSSVSSELTPAGRSRLETMALFLTENKQLKLSLVSAYNMSDDTPFCSLLNQARLRTMTEFLVSKGVSPKAIVTSSVRPANAPSAGKEAVNSAAAASSLTVFFTFVR